MKYTGTSVPKKINKSNNADRLLGILCFSAKYVLSFGMPLFTGSNYSTKKARFLLCPSPFEEEGVYCFANVGRSVGRSVRR